MPHIPDAELERLKWEVSLERLIEGRAIALCEGLTSGSLLWR